MPVFFNGRLWVTPAVMSLVDDSRMYNKNLSVGNVLCIIGRSEGGKPLSPIYLSSPYEAKEVLRGGELLKACEKAFDPSPQTVGPSHVVAIRVNPAVQATGALRDTGGNVAVVLTSEDYGKYTSGIRLKVETGSERGKKVTTQFGLMYYSADNVHRDAFAVQYVGSEASATITMEPKIALEIPPASLGGGVIWVNSARSRPPIPRRRVSHRIQTSQNRPKPMAARDRNSAILLTRLRLLKRACRAAAWSAAEIRRWAVLMISCLRSSSDGSAAAWSSSTPQR